MSNTTSIEAVDPAAEEIARRGKHYRTSEDRTAMLTEYYLTDHWLGLRNLKLSEAGYKCEFCGKTKELQVHHNRYWNLYDVTLADLMVLCVGCHLTIHTQIGKRKIQMFLSRFQAMELLELKDDAPWPARPLSHSIHRALSIR